MSYRDLKLSSSGRSVTFEVWVQPRASRTEIVGEYGGGLKMRVAAPPVDGRANEECRRFFARFLKVPIDSVEIMRGSASRSKIIRVYDVGAERVREALESGAC